ncbi:serine protease [Microbispora sp. NPDC049125]|uniref:trypsin-like serine peptidase n=1 Tax=Microbispora sp. NPDC049125 TaxID=3154929 RepID=UPI0034661E5C
MNTRVKRLILPIGGVAVAGLIGATVTVPAQAAGDTASDPLATSGIAAKNVIAYWLNQKAANLVSASPYETQVTAKHISSGGPSADSKPGTVPAIGDEKKSGGTSKNVNLPRTTGKVFFRGADGRPHWCSATSVQSHYRNLVATAGHCVYDTKSNKATLDRWVFIPGYYQGKAPWGIYVGKQAFTHYDFDVYEDGDRDYAFVTVYNGLKAGGGSNLRATAEWTWKQVDKATYDKYDRHIRRSKGGKYYIVKFTDAGRLGDNVGGQGLAYNQKLGKSVYVFGYPSGSHPDGNHAFTGQTLKWSYGKTFAAKAPSVKAEELVGVKSSFTGEGSSGSAWLLSYKNSRRLGYLNGVTSGVADTNNNQRIDTSVSPYFDGELYGVYKAAAGVWSGSIA